MNALPLDLLDHVFSYSNRVVVSNQREKAQVDHLYEEHYKTISAHPHTFLHRELAKMNPGLPSSIKVQGAICAALGKIEQDRRFLPLWAQINPPGKFDWMAINQQGSLIEEARNVNLLKFVHGLRSQHPSAVQFTHDAGISDANFFKDHQNKASLARKWLRENERDIFGATEERRTAQVYSYLRHNQPVPKKYMNVMTIHHQKKLLLFSVANGTLDTLNALIDADSFKVVPLPTLEAVFLLVCIGNPIPFWREGAVNALIYSGRLKEISMNPIQSILAKTDHKTFEQLLGALVLLGRFNEIDWKGLGKRFEEALRWTVCWGYISEFNVLFQSERMAQVNADDLYMTLASAVYGGHDQVVTTLTQCNKFEEIDKKLLGHLFETAATYGYADIALILFNAGNLSQNDLMKALTGAAKSGKNGTILIFMRYVKLFEVSVDVLAEAVWSAIAWGNGEGLKILINNLDKAKISLKNCTTEKLFALLNQNSIKDKDVLQAVDIFKSALHK